VVRTHTLICPFVLPLTHSSFPERRQEIVQGHRRLIRFTHPDRLALWDLSAIHPRILRVGDARIYGRDELVLRDRGG
jgi:hypothetical protein